MTRKEPAIPRAAQLLIKRLAPGWRHRVTHGAGTVQVGHIDRDLRKRVTTQEPCTSVAVRMRHTDGRAAVAVWVGGKFDGGWRWTVCREPECPNAAHDHAAEPPRQINSRQVTAYVSAPDTDAAMAALAEAGPKKRKEAA